MAYGVERLKTHVKLALVVREEEDGLRRCVHVGTGNYHTGTAKVYEDLGLLSCEPDLAAGGRGCAASSPPPRASQEVFMAIAGGRTSAEANVSEEVPAFVGAA